MSWPAGTIVVCVDDKPNADPALNACATRWIAAGEYYTIRGQRVTAHRETVVHLSEIHCRIHPASGLEAGWNPNRFRIAESTHSEAGTVRQQEPVTK